MGRRNGRRGRERHPGRGAGVEGAGSARPRRQGASDEAQRCGGTHGLSFRIDTAPFGRSRDRAAIAVAWSDASPGAGERAETLIEAYYRFALSSALSLTPDPELVIDPALDTAAGSTLVLGLRAHLRF